MAECRQIVDEPLRFFEYPGKRVLDLRPLGVPFLSTLSVSRLKVVSKGPQALHVHRGCVEIVYCVRGGLSFETPERFYPFLPGMIFVSRDDEPHRLSANPKGHFVYRVLVETPRNGAVFAGLTKAESDMLLAALESLPRCFQSVDSSVCQAFRKLFEIYDRADIPAARRSFELRTGAYELLRQVIISSEQAGPWKGDAKLELLSAQIREFPERDYDFEKLRGKLPSYAFARDFSRVAGMPPQAFWRACKIRRAQEWLRQGGMSVTEVSTRLNFCSTQHFATVFRKETGCSPTQWKESGSPC